MKALAGPAMLLVMIGGFVLFRATGAEDAPSREFRELEFAGGDAARTGSCYSLDTVLIANRIGSNATRSWESPREDAWTLTLQEVENSYGGPVHRVQKFTFERSGEQVRLVAVDASQGLSTNLRVNIDELLTAPNDRRSTPVDRCGKDGGAGYRYRRN